MIKGSDRRALVLIEQTIQNLDLDLSGVKVLTEVGSDYYKFLPIIAGLAGAQNVFAWTRDSRFGKAKNIIERCQELLDHVGLKSSVQFFDGEINFDHLRHADLITNSGFLRPLDEEKLKHCKDTVVIPLMFEKWEIRPEDINLEYCQKNHIKVAGTSESHPDIQVFQYVGPLAIKMAMEAGFEILGNKICVWSDDDFGDEATKAFYKLGAREVIQTTNFQELISQVDQMDFVFVADYSESRTYFSNDFFDLDQIIKINSNLGMIHLYGCLNYLEYKNKMHGMIYPEKDGAEKVMSFSLGHVGHNPIIKLQTAGLKVGELMMKNKSSRLMQPVNF